MRSVPAGLWLAHYYLYPLSVPFRAVQHCTNVLYLRVLPIERLAGTTLPSTEERSVSLFEAWMLRARNGSPREDLRVLTDAGVERLARSHVNGREDLSILIWPSLL